MNPLSDFVDPCKCMSKSRSCSSAWGALLLLVDNAMGSSGAGPLPFLFGHAASRTCALLSASNLPKAGDIAESGVPPTLAEIVQTFLTTLEQEWCAREGFALAQHDSEAVLACSATLLQKEFRC